MFLFLVIGLSILVRTTCNTIASPQIRILDVAQNAFESRFYPHRLDYSDSYHQNIKETIQEEKYQRPFKSYVIYDDFPNKIFKEWEGNSPIFTKRMAPFVFHGLNVNSKAGLPEYYSYDRKHNLPVPNPTLAYQSVYSNVIKVFDNFLDNEQSFRYHNDRLAFPTANDELQSFRPPFQYETLYPQEFQKKVFENQKYSENFPKLFVPSPESHFSSFNKENSKPSNLILPFNNFFDGFAIKDEAERNIFKNQAEIIPQYETNNSKSNGRVLLCSLIRLNQKQFPENGGPCSRSEEYPMFSQEYPDYSKLSNDKIPLEHRRQHSYVKRTKRNDPDNSPQKKTKRSLGFGNGYDNWESPFSYNGKYGNFINDYYSSQENYDNYGNSNYNGYNNRNNKNRNRNRGEYNEYDDEEYQNNDDSSSQGLSSYLTNGGRRYRNRQNNDEDDEDNDENDNENNNNNKENNNNNKENNNNNGNNEDSNEEMEGQNSNGRSMNRRRKNNNSRGRRNNYNNNNDDEDFRDYHRNNNNNRQNNRRYNKKSNDYYNRNRSSYGYNSNGYNTYGGNGGYSRYGNNRGYGNDYGNGYGNNGYGSSSGYGNNGYGNYNSYGNRGLGFGGYGGYGNYGGYGGYGGYGSYNSGNGYSSFDHDDF